MVYGMSIDLFDFMHALIAVFLNVLFHVRKSLRSERVDVLLIA